MKKLFKLLILCFVILSSQNIYSQNKSLYLKDTISYGVIPHSSSFSSIAVNNKFTFECWVNPLNASGPIISKEGCWIIEHYRDGITIRINGMIPFNILTPLANYTWQHLSITFDGDINECKVYINGILRGTRTITSNIPDLTSEVYLGRRVIAGSYINNILLLDEVRIWNLVRNQQEITNSFQTSLSGNHSGLVANYKLDNAISNTLWDSSPNQNNGSLIGIYLITNDVFTPGIYSSSVWNEKTQIVTSNTSFWHNIASCPNNNTVWIYSRERKIIKTVNSGVNWVTYNLPDTNISNGYEYYVITATDENNCLITASSSNSTKVWKTTDGGSGWAEVFYQTPGFINSIKMLNENTGYMMGDPSGGRWSLWKTNNGGSSWDSTGLYLPQQSDEFSYVGNTSCDQNTGWIFYSTRNGFYKSTNFANFNYQPFSNGYYGTDLLITDNNNAIIYTSYPTLGIIKTSDGGATWISSTGIPIYNGNIGGAIGMLAKVNNEVYAVRGGNILKSTDNGLSFNPSYCPGTGGMSVIVKSLKTENNITSVYAVGFYGNVYKADIQTIGVNNISTIVPNNCSLSQNYPNPFNPSTKINFDIVKPGFVSLKVFDILGKEVATLVSENLSAGSYETDFDGSNLPSGVYFYRIETNEFTQVKKMILNK